ncbi:MAG: hypothetical protein LBK83_03070 [Treponema sp.]|jgi:hypothetical protein|nr:hypothetical protein [Treponema sp.]
MSETKTISCPPISKVEIAHLRELAKKQLEYSKLPVMDERKTLWYLHNKVSGVRPMVVMEEGTFINDILPKQFCSHPVAVSIERQINQVIAAYEIFDDDKVVPDFFPVYFDIDVDFLGLKINCSYADNSVGFHLNPIFETIEEGLPIIKPSVFFYNKEKTEEYENIVSDILDGILPVVYKNGFNVWSNNPPAILLNMMGMENMFTAMISESDKFKYVIKLITDDIKRCLRWQEENKLITINNNNDYMGSGSYCFTDELPASSYAGTVRSIDTWGFLSGQEAVGISPEHFHEYFYSSFEELSKEFGLLYWGCCEPVHGIWDKSLSRISNLRKISISNWCDEGAMADRLTGKKIIYSRKPSPNFTGIKAEFDEELFTSYIKRTAEICKGKCKTEFIFRDIYSLHGNIGKTRKIVDITRRIAETMY